MESNPRYSLKPSYFLTLILLINYIGAMVICFYISLIPVWIAFIMVAFIAWRLIINLRNQALLLNPQAIVEFWYEADRVWYLKNKAGEIIKAKLLGNSFRSLNVVILNFLPLDYNNKISVIIFPDSLTKDLFRRLRVQLLLLSKDLLEHKRSEGSDLSY